MTATRFTAKFALPLAALAVLLAGCQGLYVAGDAGPHDTSATREAPSSR
jgi:hypothetical protein